MKALKQLRMEAGITQAGLAQWLGISRAMLCKVERGVCSLSTAALLKLAQLLSCLPGIADEQAERRLLNVPVCKPADHRKADEARLKECRYQVSMLQRKLERLDAANEKHTRLYTALHTMEEMAPGHETWIQKHKDNLTKKLPACDEAARRELKKKIYLLTAEVDYINRFPGNDPTMKTDM